MLEAFLQVLSDANIKTGRDFEHFISIINSQETRNYEEILQIWNKHKNNLTTIARRLKDDRHI